MISLRSLRDLWKTLAIPARLRDSSGIGFAAAPESIDCSEGCEAKIVNSDRILPEGDDSIVRVCTQSGQTCRFLLLHRAAEDWGLIDYLDSPYEKYELPEISVVASRDRRWVVKSSFAGGGSGVYRADSQWFELECGVLRPVLTVPLHGDDVNARPARYFQTRFKTYPAAAGRESLEFAYVVRFEDYVNSRELWHEERTVVFSRQNSGSQFTLDASLSDLTFEFADKVFAFDSLDEEGFIEFAFDRLMAIAAPPAPPVRKDRADTRRAWLRDFLQHAPDSEKARSLKMKMAGAN
jgi:hypothetical protein